MKNIIEIMDKNNNKRKVEVVVTFRLEGYDYNYIIYRELDNSHNYVAKYLGDDIVNLITDLSEKEMELANKIFVGVKQ